MLATTACTNADRNPSQAKPPTTTITANAQPGETTTTVQPHDPTAATGLLALRPGDANATDPSQYSVVIMNAWEANRIPAIKARSPKTIVLVYKDMSSTRDYAVTNGQDDAERPTGVGYADADKSHPEWFLTDTKNKRVEWKGYGGHWWMDIGNAAYADAWTANVVDELTRANWDGVFVDNAMYTPDFYLPPGKKLAKYRNDAAYSAATEAFLTRAGAAVQQAGKRFTPNFGARFPDTELYKRWIALGSGAMREHFGRYGTDGKGEVITGASWDQQIDQQEQAGQQGKAYVAVTYAKVDDVEFQTYARASFLLGWDGRPDSALLYTPPKPGQNPWAKAWTRDIGTPTGPREQTVTGAWRRTFTKGTVVVNPSASATATIEGVTLPPATGRVLEHPANN
jgi:hypothetical protein